MERWLPFLNVQYSTDLNPKFCIPVGVIICKYRIPRKGYTYINDDMIVMFLFKLYRSTCF